MGTHPIFESDFDCLTARMARKKEQAVMVEVGDEAEFNQFIDKPGLAVVDVYQTWCGPCKPVQALFKRLKVELGQSNVNFATADTERIPQLGDYAGDCEPIFVLYGGGKRGVNLCIW